MIWALISRPIYAMLKPGRKPAIYKTEYKAEGENHGKDNHKTSKHL